MEKNEKLDIVRKAALVLNKIRLVLFLIDIILLFSTLHLKQSFIPLVIISLITALVFIVTFFIELIIAKKLKKEMMQKLSLDINNFRYEPDKGLEKRYFDAANFIKNYNKYSACDYMSGSLESGKSFAISEIVVKNEQRDREGRQSEFILFSGIFGMMTANNEYNFDLNITPDFNNKYLNQMMNDLKKMLGANKNVVRLENPEFERYFEVYSDNQVEARKVLTINFMEKLLNLRKKMKKKITVIYKSRIIYFFIEKGTIINEKLLLKHGITKETMDNTLNNIKEICETIDLL